jgi:hypothetical protein
MGLLNPLFGRERERIEPGLFSKPVEFHGFKSRVVELFQDTEKLNGVAVTEECTGECGKKSQIIKIQIRLSISQTIEHTINFIFVVEFFIFEVSAYV